MRVHHLNCGSMREIAPDESERRPLPTKPAVCHCLLLEAEDRLIVVDTGLGLTDVRHPEESLGLEFLGRAAPLLDENETLLRQVERLGFDPADVRDIVLTHLDLDHSGGVPDFPHARVHVHQAELDAAVPYHGRHPEDRIRYRSAHWAHEPHWVTYAETAGDPWFGFDAVRELRDLPAEILLIPLAGHTAGHCAVAAQADNGWLLHAGDAYYYHGELDAQGQRPHPLMNVLANATEVERPLRLGNLARLRELHRDHADTVSIVSAHDPWELAEHQEPAADLV
ncbi:MBL fold metallo-hydrolase [Streptacidiphilus sp. 4-A2]|nr:MBL fold metallo-hydrolase [Streptacidiphilus sp. 4-A2]